MHDTFIKNGFVKIENAFSKELAEECREILWKDSGVSKDPTSWTNPVVRLGEYIQGPFVAAANTKELHAAYDSIVGAGRWAPKFSLGSFIIRFPTAEIPNDDGWHIDASFPGNNPGNFFDWRINVSSKGRALLMLFLLSDVTSDDAPTRLQIGSHLEVARLLETYGEQGISFMDVARKFQSPDPQKIAYATGSAGTVYLCHPFIVHAGQAHRGKNPKFMAQPALFPKVPVQLERADGQYSAVESAIRFALVSRIPFNFF